MNGKWMKFRNWRVESSDYGSVVDQSSHDDVSHQAWNIGQEGSRLRREGKENGVFFFSSISVML